MIEKEKSISQDISKLKEKAKDEKKQIEMIKAFLKQLKSVYNEDLVEYNEISSDIIQQEKIFEDYNKQITKIQLKLNQIIFLIDEEFVCLLSESIDLIHSNIYKELLLCFGFPLGINAVNHLSFENPKHLIEILNYAESLQESLFIDNNSDFINLKEHVNSLKSATIQPCLQITQLFNYFALIQEKIMIENDKATLLKKYELINKHKNEYFICLKEKEKEINSKYNLYKLKSEYIKKIGNLLKQHKEYELIGNNYTLVNEMTAKITELINTKIECVDIINASEFNDISSVQNKYEDSLSESFLCSFINDYSANQELLQLKPGSRMISNGNEVISLSLIIDKEAKMYCNKSNLNKRTSDNLKRKNEKVQPEKSKFKAHDEVSEQSSQMIEDNLKYNKQSTNSKILSKGTEINSIQTLNTISYNLNEKIVRGKQKKVINFKYNNYFINI